MPSVLVLQNKRMSGLGAEPPGFTVRRHPTVELAEALNAAYKTDAHFTPYTLIDERGEPMSSHPPVSYTHLEPTRPY